ncbi:MAG: putative esterase [Burkholderia sp.]|nr:putative esterase [Burkholderia sp.]
MSVTVVTGSWAELGAAASAIRHEVFVEEQRVPVELELDEFDAVSIHALALDGETALGTGRLLPDAHIGRMAVRREARGGGIGSKLLRALMQQAQQRGDSAVVLHAQLSAVGFYQRHGYTPEGDVFMDAGIEHIAMRHTFSPG